MTPKPALVAARLFSPHSTTPAVTRARVRQPTRLTHAHACRARRECHGALPPQGLAGTALNGSCRGSVPACYEGAAALAGARPPPLLALTGKALTEPEHAAKIGAGDENAALVSPPYPNGRCAPALPARRRGRASERLCGPCASRSPNPRTPTTSSSSPPLHRSVGIVGPGVVDVERASDARPCSGKAPSQSPGLRARRPVGLCGCAIRSRSLMSASASRVGRL